MALPVRHQRILDAAESYPLVAARVRKESPGGLRKGVQWTLDGQGPPYGFDSHTVFGWIEKEFRGRGVTIEGTGGGVNPTVDRALDSVDKGTDAAEKIAANAADTFSMETTAKVLVTLAFLYVGYHSGAISAVSDVISAGARRIG